MTASRYTKGQQVVLEILKDAQQPLSAQQIFVELQTGDRPLGLATVYRAVSSLKDAGALQQVDLGDSQAYYQLIPGDRHSSHHLICTNCRKVMPLDCCPLGDLERQLAAKHDFEIERHVLDFYGLCADCQKL